MRSIDCNRACHWNSMSVGMVARTAYVVAPRWSCGVAAPVVFACHPGCRSPDVQRRRRKADTVPKTPTGLAGSCIADRKRHPVTVPTDSSAISPISARQRWRLRVYPVASLLVLAVVVVLVTIATDPGDGRVGGDYPAFYAAGEIARSGDWDSLYDPAVQQQVQAGLIDDEGGFLYFAYPPFVAATYGITTGLGYSASFLLQVAVMGIALAFAVALMRPAVRAIEQAPLAAYALALFFYPMLVAVVGGQNTALTLALIVVAAWTEDNDREWLAGVAIGLLFYKPQFALPLLLLLLIGRRWKGAAGAVMTAVVLWVASALLMGSDWVSVWWSEATDFAATNAEVNAHLFVSFPGLAEHVAGDAGAVVGWLLAVGVAFVLAWFWWRLGGRQPWVRYGAAAAGLALIVPQALFYEAGLLVLPLALLWTMETGRRRWVMLLWAGAWLQVFSSSLDVSPLFITVVVTFVWYVIAIRPTLAGPRAAGGITAV